MASDVSIESTINPVVAEFEGGQRLKAYPPPAAGSGVTVATGIDLGQRSVAELKDLGLDDSLIKKVTPYLGLKDTEAKASLKLKPLSLTKPEADALDTAVGGQIIASVAAQFKKDSGGIEFSSLPDDARTVVESLAYNLGPELPRKLPTIWKLIIDDDWAGVQKALRETKWKQPELVDRRNKEASLLSDLIQRKGYA